MPRDPRDTTAGQSRQSYDNWGRSIEIKKWLASLAAIIVIGYIAWSLFVPDRVWNRWKQQLFGPPTPAPTPTAPSPAPTTP